MVRMGEKTSHRKIWLHSGIIAGLVLSLLMGSMGLSQAQEERVEKVSEFSFNRTLRKLDQAFKASGLLILGEFDHIYTQNTAYEG